MNMPSLVELSIGWKYFAKLVKPQFWNLSMYLSQLETLILDAVIQKNIGALEFLNSTISRHWKWQYGEGMTRAILV
ncbi:unnamed protein product [Ilex paraguariensis]|uniref:Uncharacterized protein n=1 Tax=Ilex paraguariensis TaxID=185542 RepID=A0ABC8RGG4_9AQUA